MSLANLKPLKVTLFQIESIRRSLYNDIQVWSLATPNGAKVTTFLEDLNNEYGLPYEYVK
jgi:hypothetical protein